MKLEKLTLLNYRGFEKLELEFNDSVTVLAGVNGCGKSGILKALRQLLSHFEDNVFALNSNIQMDSTDVRIGRNSMSLGLKASAEGEPVDVQLGRNIIPESDFPKIQEQISKLRQDQRYHPKRSDEAIGIEVTIEHLEDCLRGYEDFESIYAPGFHKLEFDPTLPVFAFYSTNRAFTDLPKRLVAAKRLSVESAHTDSLKGGRVNLNDFANWYRVVLDGELGNEAKNEKLWSELQSSIEALLPDFRDLRLERGEGRLPAFTVEKCGERFGLNQLSDGEKALLAVASDLTQRLSLANPHLDRPAREGGGVVLIDEVELHLHPGWQQLVIPRLMNAFPKVQFIVTTHSPQVLTSVHSKNIKIIRDGKAWPAPGGMFGAESKRALERAMGVESRPQNERVEKLDELYRLIAEEKFSDAIELAKSLDLDFSGEEPAISEALTIIKNRIWEKEMGI
jgi:predicted ATP-binding protein involved in virulence